MNHRAFSLIQEVCRTRQNVIQFCFKQFTEKLLNATLFYCSKRLLKLKHPIIARSTSVSYLINPEDPSILVNWMSPIPILGVFGQCMFFIFILFRIDIPVSKQ